MKKLLLILIAVLISPSINAQDYFTTQLQLAQQGNAEAQSKIGAYYSEGYGVAKDYNKAFDWFLKAAKQGNAMAQYGVGVYYIEGNGVTKEIGRAHV